MIKEVPSLPRIAAMVTFAMSCVGILLFLWLQFGGPIPLRPEAYNIEIAFPEATGLQKNLDVRASGITIGKVRDVRVDHGTSRTVAKLAIESEYAPLPSDMRAILRTKTLLGETFVELSPGTRGAAKIFDGGRLPDGQVGETVELDEIFQTYDPTTRKAIQLWQQELGRATRGRGENINNAIGNLPEFADSTSDLLEVLYRQEGAVRGLFRDTGEVYEALTQDEGQLSNVIRNSHALFSQTASTRESLAEAFHIFPTFLEESRLTLKRAEDFSRHARPLVRDLRPVAEELRPTLVSLRSLAPSLRTYFNGFDRQIDVSDESLPALREILDETGPLFRSLGPFLSEFNPIFEWLELHQHLVADFLGNGSTGTKDTVDGIGPNETGHYLRQLGPTGAESLGVHPRRLSSNRGNSYFPPIIPGRDSAIAKIFPNWDCLPANNFDPAKVREPVDRAPGPPSRPACFVRENFDYPGKQGRFIHVNPADYRR
ncbi:MAG: MlaD family protein [Actinomycetota bacterium]|nr:MlaD family protein [Actinomycetota bacterium]